MDVAHCLHLAFRHHDIIGRIGGDEFAVISINASIESEKHLRENLFTKISDFNKKTAEPYQLALSIGAAYSNSYDELTSAELIHKADLALYKAKKEAHLRGASGE